MSNKEIKKHPILSPLAKLIARLEMISGTEDCVATATTYLALPKVSENIAENYPSEGGSVVMCLNDLRLFLKSIQTKECAGILQEYTGESIYANDEHFHSLRNTTN